jgi:hypothetical protein
MSLSKGQKITGLVLLGSGVLAFLYYQSKKNQEEANTLLDYINMSVSQVDKNAAAEQGIKTAENTKLDPKKIHVADESGKDLFGDLQNPAIKTAMGNIMFELQQSMSGAGTDQKRFYKAFTRIRNKNTMGLINNAFKGLTGEKLFDYMKGESALNSTAYKVFSDKTKYDLMIPGLTDSHWAPAVSEWLSKISLYN